MESPSAYAISNQAARRVFLERHGLGAVSGGLDAKPGLPDMIDKLGFVQVDSINTVSRAHHMILRSRVSGYRETHLKRLLEKDRLLFEHWTHDASVIPMAFFPHWRLRFDRDRIALTKRWNNWRRDGFQEKFDDVLKQISDHGPATSSTVGEGETRKSGGWWDWHPSKTALEFLWRTGELSVCHRRGFQKAYDLTERVIPSDYVNKRFDEAETIDWAAGAALQRLGFATSGEIAAFWDLITAGEAKNWCEQAAASGRIVPVDVTCADGRARRAYALPRILDGLADIPPPPGRIRVLSPFDPALRDRKRAERLFGFFYRIEVFVPEAKREYGYYVFPVLEGDRLIGRIDMKAFRDREELNVRAFWPEKHAPMGKGRKARLESELERVAKFSGCSSVNFQKSWVRDNKYLLQ